MQITLNETEIFQALEDYVRSQISINDSQRVEIDLKAGRGENGFSATLDISAADSAPAPKQEPAPKAAKPPKEKAPKPAPVFEQEDKEADASEEDTGDEAPTEKAEAPAKKSIFSK